MERLETLERRDSQKKGGGKEKKTPDIDNELNLNRVFSPMKI